MLPSSAVTVIVVVFFPGSISLPDILTVALVSDLSAVITNFVTPSTAFALYFVTSFENFGERSSVYVEPSLFTASTLRFFK